VCEWIHHSRVYTEVNCRQQVHLELRSVRDGIMLGESSLQNSLVGST
jgi:hypothetical protein